MTPINNIKSAIGGIASAAERAVNWMRSLFSASREMPAPAGGLPGSMQRGGIIPGYGGGDTVPAMLTPGEFVMNIGAVAKYGVGFMHMLNAQRYALGGFVDHLGSILPERMRFAEGGNVPPALSSLVPIHLHLGGQVFATHADADVANRLARYSSGRQISSNGAKPSWFG